MVATIRRRSNDTFGGSLSWRGLRCCAYFAVSWLVGDVDVQRAKITCFRFDGTEGYFWQMVLPWHRFRILHWCPALFSEQYRAYWETVCKSWRAMIGAINGDIGMQGSFGQGSWRLLGLHNATVVLSVAQIKL